MQPSRYRYSIIFACAVLFFFFFQLISDFVAAIYAIGLLSLSLTIEVASALLLLSPLILVSFRKVSSWKLQIILGTFTYLCWIIESFLNTRGRMYVSGLGTACFLIFLPSFLLSQPEESGSWIYGISLALGVVLSILTRTANSSLDLSMANRFGIGAWGFVILLGLILLQAIPAYKINRPAPTPYHGESHDTQPMKIIGLCLGIAASLVFLYFVCTSPAIIARWTEASYLLILGVLLLAMSAFVVGLAWKPSLLERLHPFVLLAWNGLFVACLTLTLLAHQVHFPSTPVGYPFTSSPPPWQAIPLFLMLFLSPVILVDFTLFCQEITLEKPSIRLLGGSFAIGSLFMLVMIFAQVFTTVYDYIPLVGPLFRDRFWLVFLAAGVVMTLPTLLIRKTPIDLKEEESFDKWFLIRIAVLTTVITVITVSVALLTAPTPSSPSETGSTTLRVLTFNIQQGYSRDGQINLDGQLALLRTTRPDVIGLQESDTARISGGNADTIRYFADRLNMFSYYGPNTVAGTFGIALLSRYPIQDPRTFYLYSVGEQTAVIYAQIVIGEKTYQVFVTHLGNDGPIIQQTQVLQLVQGKDNVLLMGDFNFRPDTDQYRLTTRTLADAWLLRPPQNNISQGFDPSDRIDYLYLSPGTKVVESEYIPASESDHPALITELER